MKPIVAPLAVWKAVREVRRGAGDERPIVVAGARELVPVLARELTVGGEARAVREGAPAEQASVLVYVLAGAVTPEAEAELRAAAAFWREVGATGRLAEAGSARPTPAPG